MEMDRDFFATTLSICMDLRDSLNPTEHVDYSSVMEWPACIMNMGNMLSSFEQD